MLKLSPRGGKHIDYRSIAMTFKNDEDERILISFKELKALIGLSRTFVWRLQRRGEFPAPVKVGQHRVAWRRSEVDAWVASR